jgi:hypothetical protein
MMWPFHGVVDGQDELSEEEHGGLGEVETLQ